jgi:hypothetical protein
MELARRFDPMFRSSSGKGASLPKNENSVQFGQSSVGVSVSNSPYAAVFSNSVYFGNQTWSGHQAVAETLRQALKQQELTGENRKEVTQELANIDAEISSDQRNRDHIRKYATNAWSILQRAGQAASAPGELVRLAETLHRLLPGI